MRISAKRIQITEAAKCLWLRKMNGDRRQKYRWALWSRNAVPNKIREVKVTQVNSKTILGNSTPPVSDNENNACLEFAGRTYVWWNKKGRTKRETKAWGWEACISLEVGSLRSRTGATSATNHCIHPAACASRMVALNYFAVRLQRRYDAASEKKVA